jgi:hypothetical protein
MQQEVRRSTFALAEADKQAPDRRAFTPWRRTRDNTAARRLAEAVAQLITEQEQRGRQRKAKDAATFAAAVDTVIANLLHVQLSTDATTEEEHRGRLTILLSGQHLKSASSGKTRYDRSPIPLGILRTRNEQGRDTRPGILDVMADLELIFIDVAPRHPDIARPSTLKCADRMHELIAEHDPSLSDLETRWSDVTFEGKTVERELLVLRAAKVNRQLLGIKPSERPEFQIDYEDDEKTETLREQIRRINQALDAADITFDRGNGRINGWPVPSVGVATNERALRRIFNNGRWDHGGRLHDGFWINMKRELRDGIRIDGHRVINLDFSSMYLLLLYAMKAKKPLPDGDLYEGIDPLEGWPSDPERKKAIRDVIKANVNAMMFRKPSQIGKPYELVGGSRAVLTKGVTGAVLEERLKDKHRAIAKWIGAQDVGFELMHHESEIMIKTVLSCLEHGVVVLPIHDGLLVAECHKESARSAMQEEFNGYTGGFVARVSW